VSRDNIPTVPIQTLPLDADLFEEDYLKGMVPILFAENQEAAGLAMAVCPVLARKDVNKLQKLLIAPESLSPEAALQVKP